MDLYGTAGGIVPSPDQVAQRIRSTLGQESDMENKKTPTVPVNTDGLPPCEQAQSDGVPCTELGRDCDVCEREYARVVGETGNPD